MYSVLEFLCVVAEGVGASAELWLDGAGLFASLPRRYPPLRGHGLKSVSAYRIPNTTIIPLMVY